MNIQEEIRELEKKGVYIEYRPEHYLPNGGSNLCFAIEFTKHLRPGRGPNDYYRTGLYNDNHEFGDAADVIEAAIKIAKWLLDGDRLKWYFYSSQENVTEEGRAKWKKYNEMREEFDAMLVASFPTYAAFAKSIDDYIAKKSETDESDKLV
jgi:hypothetical protein